MEKQMKLEDNISSSNIQTVLNNDGNEIIRDYYGKIF